MIEVIGSDYCPSKIVCVGRNYIDHAKELGNEVPTAPLLFLKAPSSFVPDGKAIVLPEQSSQVEHEAELGIVIAKQCKGLADDADITEYIKGLTCVNDVTARDVQRNDVQFTRGKSFDTFCPIGPHIVADLDLTDISVVCRVNGEIRQSGRTSQMVFSPAYLIRYISRQMTLMPGDVIATGTPAGVSKLSAGDICEVEIEGIGILSNPIIAAKD
ncbi:MAG: fumarylacetoacetate hydrolase family protein [Acidobacteria bacterium]|nr:fumarylacetoacetate hydrolase family protein [Acidobacteriota bacterium]